MIRYTTYGPTARGEHLVVHLIPGCSVPAADCVCTTPEQAAREADRLNALQRSQEKAIATERAHCGFRRNISSQGGNY